MKPNLPVRFLSILLVAGLLAVTGVRADDERSTATVKLSAPGKPATLRIDMPWADIHIVGVDGDTVTVVSTLAEKNSKPARPGGLRRLDDEVSFELSEHENVVSLRLAGDNPWAGHDAEFKIQVPRAMALSLKTDMGGDLVVKNVEGDIEVSNMNGEVVLEGLVGSAVVNTMNGEVRAIYAKAPQKLVSITSMNGEVDLRVPGDTKANLKLRTHNGSILTDFDENVLKAKSEGGKASYGWDGEGSRISADAARMASDAARIAVQVSRDVARGVKREFEKADRESSEDEAPSATAGTTPHAPHPAHAPRAPRPPMPPITGGKLVSGTLNGGGIDIKISTMNGEITLRQAK